MLRSQRQWHDECELLAAGPGRPIGQHQLGASPWPACSPQSAAAVARGAAFSCQNTCNDVYHIYVGPCCLEVLQSAASKMLLNMDWTGQVFSTPVCLYQTMTVTEAYCECSGALKGCHGIQQGSEALPYKCKLDILQYHLSKPAVSCTGHCT